MRAKAFNDDCEGDDYDAYVIAMHLCRQLERELTEVTKQRDALADALQYALAYPMTDNWYGKAMEALATLKPCS